MADVELRHLTTLATVAEEGTFGRAAERLGYTQSTVSQQIAALERAVDGAVFDRPGGPRPVRITPLGEVVLDHGRELLGRARALSDAVERFRAGEGRVDIGTFQSLSNTILPPVVRRLRDEHPRCDIRLYEEEPDRPEIGDLDLLFYDGILDGELEHLKLLDDPYLLVAPRGEFDEGPVRAKELDGVPTVAWPPICDQPRMELALARGGARPNVVFRTAGNETIVAMIRAGMGVAVLPWLAIHGSDIGSDDRLRVHELRPSIPPREIHVHWPAGRTHSPLAARALDIAVDVASELTAKRATLLVDA